MLKKTHFVETKLMLVFHFTKLIFRVYFQLFLFLFCYSQLRKRALNKYNFPNLNCYLKDT